MHVYIPEAPPSREEFLKFIVYKASRGIFIFFIRLLILEKNKIKTEVKVKAEILDLEKDLTKRHIIRFHFTKNLAEKNSMGHNKI